MLISSWLDKSNLFFKIQNLIKIFSVEFQKTNDGPLQSYYLAKN